MFKNLYKEPLVHFLLLGASVFFLYALTNDNQSDNENSIVISKAQQDQLHYRWQKKQMRPPSNAEMQEMIDKEIYTAVMYKEALKMGLDENDYIIRRRLTQKLEFVSNDLSSLVEPSEEELRNYLKTNANTFKKEGKTSFKQVYIDRNKHSAHLKERIAKVQHAVDNNESVVALSDNFMLPTENKNLSKSEIIRTFGKMFESSLKSLKSQRWEGPVKSAYGLHFVHIEQRLEGELPSFESMQAVLRKAWLSEKKEHYNKVFYETLKKGYIIEIEK